MTGEVIKQDGVSGWVSVGAGVSLTAGAFVQASASTLATLLAATEEDYPMFDLRLQVTAGTPTEAVSIEIHLRDGDGVNQEPAPGGAYQPHRVGAFILDNAAGYFFARGLPLLSKNSQIYLKSNEESTALTVTLHVKAKSINAAA